MSRAFLVIDPEKNLDVLKGLASPVRVSILKLLHVDGAKNVNELAAELDLPQSTVSSNVQILEEAGLITTESQKARKGSQKICHSAFDEILVAFQDDTAKKDPNAIEVSMPLGLYTACDVTGPCGLCSSEGVIGLLDVPETFLDPGRMKAALLWFTRGYVEYQFPNNSKLAGKDIASLEFSVELSSEVPGTAENWPSDITLWVNGVEAGTWTSPGDFGDKRGLYTPAWWKRAGSQYGKLKTWRITDEGTFVDGEKVAGTTLGDLALEAHRSIRLRIGVTENAKNPGGINVFGRGFGNYDQEIEMRILTR